MAKRPGIVCELFHFVREQRAYWLVPFILAVLVLATLVALGSTAAAPFIYTLF